MLAYQRDYYAAHKEEICAAKKAYRRRTGNISAITTAVTEPKMLEYGRKYREAKKLRMM
jgi:hypothetical protein